MTIQTSSSNKNRFFSCFKDVFMRNKGLGIFYFCLSFVFLPAQYIMAISKFNSYNNPSVRLNDIVMGSSLAYTPFSMFAFYALTVGMAFAIPIIMLSYMQNKRAVDVYHSLPYKRDELLGANILSGLLYIMIPIIIDFSVIGLISLSQKGAKPMQVFMEIFYWLAPVMGIMAITTLACVLVGTTFDSFLFSAGLHITPVALWGLLLILSENYLLGFNGDSKLVQVLSKLSPFIVRIPFIGEKLEGELLKEALVTTAVWIFISIAIFALAFFCYKRRKSEQAETATEKGALSTILRAVGTLCGGLLLGYLFSATTLQHNFKDTRFLFFVFAGSLIVYLVGDVIISKRIRKVKKAFLPGCVFSLGVVLVVSSFFFDFFHYSTYVPKLEEIESVEIGNYNFNYRGRFHNQPDYRLNLTTYESPEVIEAVHSFHTSQAEYIREHGAAEVRLRKNEDDFMPFNFNAITYTLKNGKEVSRKYIYPFMSDTESILELETSDEFIKANHPLFVLNEKMVKQVSAINLFGSRAENLKLSSRNIDTLLLALQEDMLSPSGKDILNKHTLGKISLLVSEDDMRRTYNWEEKEMEHYDENSLTQITVTVTDGFESTLKLLKALGMDDVFVNDVNELERAYLLPVYGSDRGAVNGFSYNDVTNMRLDKNEDIPHLSLNDLKLIEDDLRGYNLHTEPYAEVVFVSDAKSLETIEKEGLGYIYDPSTDSFVERTEAVEIADGPGAADIAYPTREEDTNYLVPTGMAYIPYEKLPDNLKKAFIEEKGTQYIDSWMTSNNGMSVTFYKSELERFGITDNQ